MIFVKKKEEPDGRPCIDYKKLNNITIKNRYPLLRTDTLKDFLRKAKFFTKLDFRQRYNLIKIEKGEK